MTDFLANAASFFLSIWRQILSMTVIDVVDILLLSVILYYAYKFIHDRRAGRLAVGIILFIVVLVLSELLEMHAIKFLLKNVVQVGILALIILFQPEIRSVLEEVGRDPLKNLKNIREQRDLTQINSNIGEVCTAVFEMAEEKTGALIVIERNTKLGDVIKSGTVIDSSISSFLIRNIFFNKAPLHDGAMIIRDGRLYAAGCFLPLSQNVPSHTRPHQRKPDSQRPPYNQSPIPLPPQREKYSPIPRVPVLFRRPTQASKDNRPNSQPPFSSPRQAYLRR